MTVLPARRSLLRFAQRMVDFWVEATQPSELQLPETGWHDLRRATERLRLARQRHWRHAAEAVRGIVRWQIEGLIDQLSTCCTTLEPVPAAQSAIRLSDLYADLVALHREFPVVRLDAAQQQLAVQTEPIVLDDYYLGPFEIEVNLPQLSARQPYRVIALEPHPAEHDFTTTHPHVRDEVLCEGEGRTSIRAALQQGRLLDFFILVRQVLETYNSSSAFIALDQWHGRSCPDCGGFVDDDNTTSCERCATEICYDCSYSCSRCGRGYCCDCRSRCGACEAEFCGGCLEPCATCEEDFCSDCLADGRCQNCAEPNEEECEHATPETIPATADARTPTEFAIQPVCLGKVALSA